MAKSTAMAKAVVRDLKDRLAQRGISADESQDANGWPKLTIGTDASIEIEAADAVSKDVFGNDLKAFTPHFARLATVDTQAKADYTKIVAELQKVAIDKILLKTHATTLATAEAVADADAEAITWDVRWPTKGS